MVSSVHGGDGKAKVFLDTGVGKVLLYSYENLGGRKEGRKEGRKGGREGGRQAGSWGGGVWSKGERRDGEMERWKSEARSDKGMKG